MFGTGEWASAASESTIPSRTSSSWRSGTYWRQMGSPGDLIRSTIAGEMRNSKFAAACRSRPRSGKCSAPNLATSASREAMLRLRRSSCHDSIRQILEIDHQVVAGRVVARHGGAPGVAAPLVERARRRVLRQGGCLHDHEPSAVADQPMLDRLDQPGAHPAALPRRVHDERSEEHTSELQSRLHLVCRLLLEKKKRKLRLEKGVLSLSQRMHARLHDTRY